MADPLSGLDTLAEVSDVVQRKKGLSNRMRNEAIRQGIQDPTNFQTEFAPQIQQAQQPQEFWGAGRKELANQDYDLTLPSLFSSSTQTIDGKKYYYGDYDPSKVQYGLGDYKTQDIGQGKYNILGTDGNILGTGYKSVLDTINELSPGSYQSGTGGGLADWEVLGQLLSGGSPAARQSWGSLPINNQSEQISGANTLYGSTPVFYDGKLLGYKSNFGAAPGWEGTASGSGGQDQMQWNPFGYQATHSGKSHSWATGLGRQIDPNAYQGLVRGLGGYDYFAPLSNVEKLPGWTNTENYQRQANLGGMSFLSELFRGIDPILDKVDPMHNKVQEWTTGSSDTEGQLPYFKAYMPMILNAFTSGVGGSALSAIDNASTGNTNAALANVAAAYLGGTGGLDTGYGDLANAAANTATSSAINTYAQGGDLGDMFKAAVVGALSGGAGGAVGDATSEYGKAISGMLSGATKGAVSQMAAPKHMFESALMSGLAGGLGGMFSPDNATPQQQKTAQDSAKTAVNLAKLFAKR